MQNKRKKKEMIIQLIIKISTLIAVLLLSSITIFIVKNGYKKINLDYFTSDYNDKTVYVDVENNHTSEHYDISETDDIFIDEWGVGISKLNDDSNYYISYLAKNSIFENGVDLKNEPFKIKVGDIIKKIDKVNIADLKNKDIENMFRDNNLELKITRNGGGIYPMLISTLMLIFLSLIITIPIGVGAAIYLVEYAKIGKLVNIIRFATESLAGIPSIVYGLFGMILFVKFLGIGQSILSGSLTLSIILLPTVIRTTEETLITVPSSYKEASYALGANRLQTLVKIIIPNTISGIIIAVILSIGRIVGESAALLFTVGTFAKIPQNIFDSGTSLTVRAFMEVKEYAAVESACAMGIVLLAIVFILNISTKIIVKKLKL